MRSKLTFSVPSSCQRKNDGTVLDTLEIWTCLAGRSLTSNNKFANKVVCQSWFTSSQTDLQAHLYARKMEMLVWCSLVICTSTFLTCLIIPSIQQQTKWFFVDAVFSLYFCSLRTLWGMQILFGVHIHMLLKPSKRCSWRSAALFSWIKWFGWAWVIDNRCNTANSIKSTFLCLYVTMDKLPVTDT